MFHLPFHEKFPVIDSTAWHQTLNRIAANCPCRVWMLITMLWCTVIGCRADAGQPIISLHGPRYYFMRRKSACGHNACVFVISILTESSSYCFNHMSFAYTCCHSAGWCVLPPPPGEGVKWLQQGWAGFDNVITLALLINYQHSTRLIRRWAWRVTWSAWRHCCLGNATPLLLRQLN